MTDRGIHELAATGFGRAADDYERGRPGYPDAAVAWLVDRLAVRPGRTVLDLAAGTGKLTRQLAATGATIVAVEPIEEMRRKLEEALPQVRALDGTAEAIPLPDDSVDAVAVAQAFHWFRGEEALAAIHRVLRPGGRLGLIWNARDESVEWVAQLGKIIDRFRGDVPSFREQAWMDPFVAGDLFAPLEKHECGFVQELDEDAFLARVSSISFIAVLPSAEREEVLSDVRRLLARHAERSRKGVFALPYRTEVFSSAART